MPLNLSSKNKTDDAKIVEGTAADAPQAPKTIRIQMVLHNTYDYDHYTYRKDKVYAVSPELAAHLLSSAHTDAWGRPVFTRYEPKTKERRVVLGPEEVDMTQVTKQQAILRAKATPARQELASPEEIKEIEAMVESAAEEESAEEPGVELG